MTDADVDVAVIGAGVVGLAVAARCATRDLSVAVLERHDEVGRETSSRNSEVIHAGIYYAPGSLKARLCVEGAGELYRMAEELAIGHRRCGKIIVAVCDDEIESLEKLMATGVENGVEGLRMIGPDDVRRIEPEVTAVAALQSPNTGIIDSHALMETYRRQAEAGGAHVVFGASVAGIDDDGGPWRLVYRDSSGEDSVTARAVVNAAGLGAQEVMRMAGLDPEGMGLALRMCKGEYFSVTGAKRNVVSTLVYPSPSADLTGLGIHTVVDLGGGLKLGPNAHYVDEIDYTVDPCHANEFAEGVRPFLPAIEPGDLSPDMSGVRPKLAGPGEPARDFYIAHECDHGAEGLFNLVGIESPGLTASPAIGRLVAGMIAAYL